MARGEEAPGATAVGGAASADAERHEGVPCEATREEIELVREELGYVPTNLVRVAAFHAPLVAKSDVEEETGRTPAVLLLYPLRNAEAAHKKRQRAAVEPFPTIYWLASRELKARVSILEDRRYVQILQRRLDTSDTARQRMKESHAAYARQRWGLLTPNDLALVERRQWEYALQDVGVGGIRNVASVKCLHTHYAHFLATGDNLVGEWVQELLDELATAPGSDGTDARTSSSTSSEGGE